MQHKDLYEKLLGAKTPLSVTGANLQVVESKVTVILEHEPTTQFACPECGLPCTVLDIDNSDTAIAIVS